MIQRISRGARGLCVLAACLYWAAVSVAAQTQPPVAPDGFTAMPDSQLGREQLPATPLVFAAYAFVWLALVTYIFFLFQRLRRTERDVADLTTRLPGARR